MVSRIAEHRLHGLSFLIGISDVVIKLVYILTITTNIGQKTVIYPSS